MAKILIIDDEAPIRSSLREILEYENYQVSEAEDGAEGVKLGSKFAFDVIFCDVKMPKFDGLEVLDLLKENEVTSPVVMISGHGTVDTAVEALKKGAYDFIQKPLDLNRVLLTVRHALDQGKLEKETKRLEQKIQTERSTALAMADGSLDPLRAVIDGDLLLHGDPRTLVANRDVLDDLGDLFASC